MDADLPDLRSTLRSLAGSPNSIIDSLQPGPGTSAAVPLAVRYEEQHGAVWVQTTLHGPGQLEATILDLTIDLPDLVLTTMRGGRWEQTYPPETFAPVSLSIHPDLPAPWYERHSDITFGTTAGRSSDATMPFFLLGDADGTAGLWIAVGVSGSWQAHLVKTPHRDSHRLTVVGPGCGAALADEEVLTLPRVLVGTFNGDGWAAIRRWLLEARPAVHLPWVSYNTWFNLNARIDHDILVQTAETVAPLGVEVFVIDAGWYGGDGDAPEEFATAGLGTWRAHPGKFPRGLEPVMERVRELGMIPGLWFEPERAHPTSWVVTEHPEWVRSASEEDFRLVDLGNAGAQEWALELLSGAIDRLKLGWIKWDFNIEDLTPYWSGDGRGELAHQEGLYAVIDELRRRHRDVVLEMCASGGNRIDVETLIRCDTYWISDQTINPMIVRDIVGNAARWMPAQYRLLGLSPQIDEPLPDTYPDAWWLGSTLGPLCIMDDVRRWPDTLREQAARHISEFKTHRHLLDGDSHDFVGDGTSPLGRWHAWEFASNDDAVLLAFRDRASQPAATFDGSCRWQVEVPIGGAVALRA